MGDEDKAFLKFAQAVGPLPTSGMASAEPLHPIRLLVTVNTKTGERTTESVQGPVTAFEAADAERAHAALLASLRRLFRGP